MEKILVTTDFSANSKAGIRFALQLSAQRNSTLVFYHVIEVMKPTSWSEKQYKSFAEAKTSEAMAKLKKFVSAIHQSAGTVPGNHHYTVEIGTTVDDLVTKYAKKIKAAFICMSTHGAGKFQRLIGTNASALITTSPVPVIVVPKTYKVKPLTSVFYASDFAALRSELNTVLAFSRAMDAKTEVYHYDYLLHVTENRKKLEQKAHKLLQPDLHFHFRRQEIDLTLSENMAGDIKKMKPSLIVLFTKQNRNWFDRLFAKSDSRDLAFNSNIPLLVFRKKMK